MARGALAIKQREVARTVRGAFAAGAQEVAFKVGGIEVVARKSATSDKVVESSDLDKWIAEHAR